MVACRYGISFLVFNFISHLFAAPLVRDRVEHCVAGTDIMIGTLGQPVFVAELINRLTGSPASEFCIIPFAARRFIRTSIMSSLLHLTLISIERYIQGVSKVRSDLFCLNVSLFN